MKTRSGLKFCYTGTKDLFTTENQRGNDRDGIRDPKEVSRLLIERLIEKRALCI